jgi:hypothetical protein
MTSRIDPVTHRWFLLIVAVIVLLASFPGLAWMLLIITVVAYLANCL